MVEPLTMTLSHFAHKVLQAHAPVLVDFWAPWCGLYHVMAPVIDQRAAECAGRVTVGKVHVDEQPALAPPYGIRSMPAFLVFTQGHGVDQAVGITSTHGVSAIRAAQLEAA